MGTAIRSFNNCDTDLFSVIDSVTEILKVKQSTKITVYIYFLRVACSSFKAGVVIWTVQSQDNNDSYRLTLRAKY